MPRLPDNYTRYPRPILWLVRGNDDAIESFYLGKRPVTNVQFEAFAPDHRRTPQQAADDDVAVVPFDRAQAYCAWYAEVSRKPMRLPTAREWAYARGPLPAAGTPYTNPFGLLEMGDGVVEWTAEDDASQTEAAFRVARGLQ